MIKKNSNIFITQYKLPIPLGFHRNWALVVVELPENHLYRHASDSMDSQTGNPLDRRLLQIARADIRHEKPLANRLEPFELVYAGKICQTEGLHGILKYCL